MGVSMTAPVGKILRKLRIDHDERLSDMARHLAVSPAFLSAVERGKKPPPLRLVQAVVTKYPLPADDLKQFFDACSAGRNRFQLVAVHPLACEVAGALERFFNILSSSDLRYIAGIVELARQKDAAR